MTPRDQLLFAIKSDTSSAIPRFIQDVDHTQEIENKLTLIQLAARSEKWSCVDTIAKFRTADNKDNARYGDVLLTSVFNDRNETAKQFQSIP